VDGDYSSIPVAGQKSPAKSLGIFGIFRGMSNFLFIFVTVPFGAHKSVLWTPNWGTIGYRMKCGVILVCL
jgi:hypothetical protein